MKIKSNRGNMTIWIILVVIIILGGVAFISNKNKKENSMKTSPELMSENASMMENKDSNMAKDEMNKKDVMVKSETMMAEKGSYEDYEPTKLSLAEKGKVILFFKASWCPSCQAVDKDILNNLSSIPEGVNILKVDYDNSKDLKVKYGVTYQHTFVEVDKDGKMIAKWSGSPTLADIISKIK